MSEPGKEPIEAEVVRAVVVKPARKKGHVFVPMMMSSPDRRLSDREQKFVNMVIKTGNVRAACEEIGISASSGKRYVKRPHIVAYIAKMRERLARSADLTIDKVKAVIDQAVAGEDVKPTQLQGAALAAKFLAPQGGVTIGTMNTQINNNVASPFLGMDRAAMLEAVRQNLLEMED